CLVVGSAARGFYILPLHDALPIWAVAVDPATPVRTDTGVETELQGLAGATVIALKGGSAAAPALSPVGDEPPLLVADSSGTQSLDRKSTRLNFSHAIIAYAVVCLQ